VGKVLAKKGYDYAGVKYNEVGFPQDIRNCTKCHDGSDTSTARTAQGDNWKNAPSRLACGACHDGINFATGQGVTLADALKGLMSTTSHGGFAHGGLSQADDSQCKNCHTADNIDVVHLPITPPNLNSGLHVAGGGFNTNAASIASNPSRLPTGAIKVSYEIKDVFRNATTKQPVMVFRLLQNGVVTRLNDYATTAPHPVTGRREIWNNFMGAPSVYFVFAVPQDNLTAPDRKPADFNSTVSAYLRCLWNGTVPAPDPDSCTAGGTLTGPDTDGWYTATLTPVIPDSAVMLTGGLGFSYNIKTTLPLTQTNLPDFPVTPSTVPVGTGTNDLLAGMPNATGGLIVVAPNVTKVATNGCPTSTSNPNPACVTNGTAAAYVGRRPIVEDARCNKCHQELGTFTEEAFHGGQRNDGTTCSWCHVANRMGSGSGWSADSTSFVHAIHAGAKRQKNFTWHSELEFWKIVFPGVLRQCDACHLPGTYDFSASTSLSALPNRPFRTVASGTLSASPSLSPYVTAGVAYGSGFSFSAATGVTTEAAPTTLVISPITTACFSCHDSDLAKNHMEINGGSIYAQRSTALAALPETCLVCHGTGRIADIKVMHAK
jgi:Cytochrome c7 and related cytochrome c